MSAPMFVLGESVLFESRVPARGLPVLFPADSDQALTFLTPILGPTTVLLQRKLVIALRKAPGQRQRFNAEQLAISLGVSRGVLANSLGRLATHNLAQLGVHSGIWYIDLDVQLYKTNWIDRLDNGAAYLIRRLIATKEA